MQSVRKKRTWLKIFGPMHFYLKTCNDFPEQERHGAPGLGVIGADQQTIKLIVGNN